MWHWQTPSSNKPQTTTARRGSTPRGGVRRRFAEWEHRHVSEMLDRELDNGTLAMKKAVKKGHPLAKNVARAHNRMNRVISAENTVKECVAFFRSPLFYKLGGSEVILPKLKREQDKKEKRNAEKQYKAATH